MNSTDLAKQLSKRLQITKADAEKRLELLSMIITEKLQESKTVSIVNFGNLEVKKRNERISVHPATGKKMLIPPKLVVKFKPATALTKKTKTINHE